MYLPVPNLDDRNFEQLLGEAWARIATTCPQWTDRSPHDPGTVLLEAFAYLTEVMIYRLNRLPEKAYVSFLNLLGTSRHPPSAASAVVEFTRADGVQGELLIPKGTQIATAGGSGQKPVIFTTTESEPMRADQNTVKVLAHHCVLVEGELIGIGNGQGGQVMRVKTSPIVRTADSGDVVLAVEVSPGGLPIDRRTIRHEGKVFEIWEAVTAFTGSALEKKCYLIDRASGVITFAPQLDVRSRHQTSNDGKSAGVASPSEGILIAEVPAPSRQVRLWYRTGGGPEGNVRAGALTTLPQPVRGVKEVSNPESAQGGRPLEALESALQRGPYEFFSRQRAVTARDFEMLAISVAPAAARAYAFTSIEKFGFAEAGQVDVLLVPDVDRESRKRQGFQLPLTEIAKYQQGTTLSHAQKELAARKVLGTSVRVGWAKYKPVAVEATVVVWEREDIEVVRQRLYDCLYQTISPLPTDMNAAGWKFGEPLRLSNVYRVLEQAHAGIRYVNGVRMLIDSAPDKQVRTVAIDHYQPLTAYAGAGELLFRSTNAGHGWEQVEQFTGETVEKIVPAPAKVRPGVVARPGRLAVVTQRGGADGSTGSRVWISVDLGDAWTCVAELAPHINDVAWIDRDASGSLLLATDAGLFELAMDVPDPVPLQINVEPNDADRGFYAVCTFVSERGVPGVALAAQAQLGTYLSLDEGRSGTFRHIGLSNVDTRTLAVQYDGPNTVLWTGVGEPDPQQAGRGCFRARLYEADVVWEPMQASWTGGTCRALAFDDRTIVAATHRGGVLYLETDAERPEWRSPGINCGLPLREPRGFEPLGAIAVIAVDPNAPASSIAQLLTGGPYGVFRSSDKENWTASAERDTGETLTVPSTWLICSGEHRIEVTTSDAS